MIIFPVSDPVSSVLSNITFASVTVKTSREPKLYWRLIMTDRSSGGPLVLSGAGAGAQYCGGYH